MADDALAAVYQLHVWLQAISPAIWRRLLVRSDTTIADLHHTLQIAFGWTDSHLHRFVIYGKDYGIAQVGGIHFADDRRALQKWGSSRPMLIGVAFLTAIACDHRAPHPLHWRLGR